MKKLFPLLGMALLLWACDPNGYDASSFIEMKKDPCFGFCPVYEFKVDGEGNATFSGKNNVDKEGDWKRKLSSEETKQLFDAFANSQFFQYQNEYTGAVTDLPTIWLTFNHGGESKTIKDYYGAPQELKDLEALVEQYAETEQGWTKVE